MSKEYKFDTLEELFQKYDEYKDKYDEETVQFVMDMYTSQKEKEVELSMYDGMFDSFMEIEKMKVNVLNDIFNILTNVFPNHKQSDDSLIGYKSELEDDDGNDDYTMLDDVPKFDISSFTSDDIMDKSAFEKDAAMDDASVAEPEPVFDGWFHKVSSDFIKPNRYKEDQFKVEFPYGSTSARFYLSGDDIKKSEDGTFDIHLDLDEKYRFYQGVGNNKENPDVTGDYLAKLLKDVLD